MKKILAAFFCPLLFLTALFLSGCGGHVQERELTRFWQEPNECTLSYSLWGRDFSLKMHRSESEARLTFLSPEELAGISLFCDGTATKLTAGDTEIPVRPDSLPVLYGLLAPFLPGKTPAFLYERETRGCLFADCEANGVTYHFEFSSATGLPTAMHFETGGASGVTVDAVIGTDPGQETDES